MDAQVEIRKIGRFFHWRPQMHLLAVSICVASIWGYAVCVLHNAHEIRRDEELLSKDLKSDFETLQKKQANLQKRFDALLERSVTTNYVPTWQTGVTLVLAFGLGAMVGVYLI